MGLAASSSPKHAHREGWFWWGVWVRCEIPVGAPRGSHKRAAGKLRRRPHFSQPSFPFPLSFPGGEPLGFLGDILRAAAGITGQTYGQPWLVGMVLLTQDLPVILSRWGDAHRSGPTKWP